MSLITRTYTFTDGTTAYGSQVDSEISNITTTLNNLNTAASTWDIVKSVNATSVPLIADCSSGTNNVFEGRVNGVARFTVNHLGDAEAISTGSAFARGIISTQISSDAASAHFSGKKARGSVATPTAVAALDYITGLHANPYDGTSYLLPAFADFQVTPSSSVSTGVVRTDFVLTTGDGTPSDGTERLRVDYAGHVGINKAGVSDTSGTLSVTALASTNAGRFVNTDNTFATVAIVNNGTAHALDVSSPIAFTTSGTGLLGTTTNDAANTGIVGEYKTANTGGAINFPTSTQWGDGPSISLTAGDWAVSAIIDGNDAGTASVTLMGLGISTTTGNSTTGLTQGINQFYQNPPASSQVSWSIPMYRVSLSTTTTVYTKVTATYSGTTPTFRAVIACWRMR